jgi:hypothetical protein
MPPWHPGDEAIFDEDFGASALADWRQVRATGRFVRVDG